MIRTAGPAVSVGLRGCERLDTFQSMLHSMLCSGQKKRRTDEGVFSDE